MRDRIVLRADVYPPDGEGKFPTLLCRTPYNKANMGEAGIGERIEEQVDFELTRHPSTNLLAKITNKV